MGDVDAGICSYIFMVLYAQRMPYMLLAVPLRSLHVRYAPRIHFEAVHCDLLFCPLRSSALFFENVFLVYAVETAIGIDTLS